MTQTNPALLPRVAPKQTTVLDAHQAGIEKTLNCVRVGVIQAYDPGEAGVRPPTADVLIAQQQVTSTTPDGDQTLAPYPLLRSIPVIFPAGGGFTLTFPVAVGDECLVLFHDREIDNWYINGAGLPPTTPRKHDLSDGFALVGVRSCPRALAPPSTTAVEIISDDGATKISVSTGNITLKAATITLDGTVVSTGNMTAAGISLDTHTHTGVQTGSGNTGGPV